MGIQRFERRSERIRETPDRPRPEFLVSWLAVELMHAAGNVFRSFQFALHKRLVDDHLGGDVGQFPSPSRGDLGSCRLSLDGIHRCQFRARLSRPWLPGSLPPHRPRRAELPQRVPQAVLPSPLQECVIRGRNNGCCRRSSTNRPHVNPRPRVRRLSHSRQIRRTAQ